MVEARRFRSVGFVALSCSVALRSGACVTGGVITSCATCSTITRSAVTMAAIAASAPASATRTTFAFEDYYKSINLFADYEHDFSYDDGSGSYSYSLCVEDCVGDGQCNSVNNIEECGYDGGDCCACDCVSTLFYTCGDSSYDSATAAAFDCIDPASVCVDGYVEVANKTVVTPFASGFYPVCMDDTGCRPALTRDGNITDVESRWSCKRDIFTGGVGECWIGFSFETAQDIKDIQVAFWKADERARTLEVSINAEVIGDFDSSPDTDYTSLGVEEDQVSLIGLKAVGLEGAEYLSILEVRFLVEP